MNPDYPPFAEAKARLQEFLRHLGHPDEIAWVFRDDLLFSGKQMLVRLGHKSTAERRAEAQYLASAKRRLGVTFDVLGVSGRQAFTHLFIPFDEEQAERFLMPDGLKLSVATPLRDAVVVRSRLGWWWQSLARRQSRRYVADVLGIEHEHDSAA